MKGAILTKNIVITGSTRGIGLAMAIEFLHAGCNVTLSGRGNTLPEAVISSLREFHGKYIYIQCNVQSKNSLQNLWMKSAEKWGEINIWINNSGQNTPHKFAWETPENYTQNIINTNVTGMIFGSQVAAENMLKQSSGAIYSMEGLGSNNMIQKKTILYGTTKRALTYFMKGLAKELQGTGVIAGRLSPGMMLTNFITKDPDGNESEVIHDEQFKKIFNILADTPQTVAKFFIPEMLKNTKNDKHIVWLTNTKTALRFIGASGRKNRLIK